MNTTISWSLCHHKAGDELTTEIAGMTNYFFKISCGKTAVVSEERKESSSLSEGVNTSVPSTGIWGSISRRAKVI